MKTIYYTKITTAPHGADRVMHAAGVSADTAEKIITHAQKMGFQMIQFAGFDDSSTREQYFENRDSIGELMESLEITRVVGLDREFSEYFPKIHDSKLTRHVMEDEEAEALIRGFTE